MDDANNPSLLSLPLLGFTNISDEPYASTRKMILSVDGNPYDFLLLEGLRSPGLQDTTTAASTAPQSAPHTLASACAQSWLHLVESSRVSQHVWPMSLVTQVGIAPRPTRRS